MLTGVYMQYMALKIKEAATEYAKLRCFYISPSFEQIYMETLEVITGKHLVENFSRLFFMICVNTENGIKYRMVIGLVSRKAAYCP